MEGRGGRSDVNVDEKEREDSEREEERRTRREKEEKAKKCDGRLVAARRELVLFRFCEQLMLGSLQGRFVVRSLEGRTYFGYTSFSMI